MNTRDVQLKAPLAGVVCAKCVKRAGGSGKKAAKDLSRALRDATGRKAQVKSVSCLKLCPKRHVLIVPAQGTPKLVANETWFEDAVAVFGQALPPR